MRVQWRNGDGHHSPANRAKEKAHSATYVPFRSERCQEPQSPASASHEPKVPGQAVVRTPFFHERAPIWAAASLDGPYKS